MGDIPSWQELAKILDVARRVARRHGAHHDEADEVAQITAVKLWEKWDADHVRQARARGPSGWCRYVAVAARNTHRDIGREARRRIARQQRAMGAELRRLLIRPGTIRPVPSDAAEVEKQLAAEMIKDEILALDGRRRQVAIRIYLEGRSIEETAKALGIAPRTVRQHELDARRRLEVRLGALAADDDGDDRSDHNGDHDDGDRNRAPKGEASSTDTSNETG